MGTDPSQRTPSSAAEDPGREFSDPVVVFGGHSCLGGRSAAARPRPAKAAPRWWRHAGWLLLWALLLVVVALWASNGGLQLARSPSDALTSTGRLCGLVASCLMLVQVLLMARIPLIERSFGQDELARRHRLVGFTSFSLMWAHIMLIWLGYAAATRQGVWGTLVDLVVAYPGILLAVGGTVSLCLVVVTSVRAARSRLRYESWHLLHLYAYLGVGLALPHQLWNGQEFLSSLAATVFWWSLWGAAVAAILVFRFGMPLYRTARHRVRVTEVYPEAPGVTTVVMGGRAAGPPSRCGGPVLPLALPRQPRLDPGPPLLVVGSARRAHPADHRGPYRRRVRRPGKPQDRLARCPRGTVRAAARRGADPGQGGAAGLRHRHHADPGTAGRPATEAGRGDV